MAAREPDGRAQGAAALPLLLDVVAPAVAPCTQAADPSAEQSCAASGLSIAAAQVGMAELAEPWAAQLALQAAVSILLRRAVLGSVLADVALPGRPVPRLQPAAAQAARVRCTPALADAAAELPIWAGSPEPVARSVSSQLEA